ncbi:MAG TPA: hypothetical protein VNZ64_24980 [Candidatus Acidoferrum sp.]|jgi:hypothetical protein|nr:hypothetical protein [Candidatus Acidoferrum sp.]
MSLDAQTARLRFLLGLIRAQSGRLALIVAAQACLVAATLISDAVLSSRVAPAIIIASGLAAGSSGLVPALATGLVIALASAFKLERYLPDFFAVCALGFPLVSFIVVLEKAYWHRTLATRWVGHVAIILSSAAMSSFCWFVLSFAAFGILLLARAG